MASRIFVDVSRTAGSPFVTGIQRVVRQLVVALAQEAAQRQIEIIPVIITADGAVPVPAFVDEAQLPWAPVPIGTGLRGLKQRVLRLIYRVV
ncbi:MAG: hypothetical protein ACRC7G_16945, partial [Beijerinckiaceae bacterium]